MNVAIANHGKAVGKYLPAEIITNSDREAEFAQHGVLTSKGEPLTADWMAKHVGLDKSHRAAVDEYTSHIGTRAVKRALRNGQLSPYHPRVFRFGTTTPDALYSAVCCLIQNG